MPLLSATVGHSLGGGLALCTFLHLASLQPELHLALAYGGVFTFGAPTVIHNTTDVQAFAFIAHQLAGSK